MILPRVDHPLDEVSLDSAVERLVVILVRTPLDVEASLAVAVDLWVFEGRVGDAIDHRGEE